jgi:hypothetical protein
MEQLAFFDLWSDQLLEQAYPELYSYAKNKRLKVSDACQFTELHELFHLPLSIEAYQQLHELSLLLNDLNILEGSHDTWSYIWNSSLFFLS